MICKNCGIRIAKARIDSIELESSTQTTIKDVVLRKSWKHIKCDRGGDF